MATSGILLLILCVPSLVRLQLASQSLEVASVIEPSHIVLLGIDKRSAGSRADSRSINILVEAVEGLVEFLAVRLDAGLIVPPVYCSIYSLRARAFVQPALEIVLKNC